MSASEIENRVWNYAHVLKDDGVGYNDYLEQITYLVFLKVADEHETAGQYFRTASDFSSSTSSAALRASVSFSKYFRNLLSQVLVALRSQSQVPNKYAWAKLLKLDGDDLELQPFENLGKEVGAGQYSFEYVIS